MAILKLTTGTAYLRNPVSGSLALGAAGADVDPFGWAPFNFLAIVDGTYPVVQLASSAADGTNGGVNVAGWLDFGTTSNTSHKEIASIVSYTGGGSANDRSGDLRFSTKGDGVNGPTERLRIDPNGMILVMTATTGQLGWNTGPRMTSPAANQMILFSGSAINTGVGFDLATDAVLKLRVRAQNAYATLDCLGLKASGAAGASGTGTVISSITVVNGIVTAISVA